MQDRLCDIKEADTVFMLEETCCLSSHSKYPDVEVLLMLGIKLEVEQFTAPQMLGRTLPAMLHYWFGVKIQPGVVIFSRVTRRAFIDFLRRRQVASAGFLTSTRLKMPENLWRRRHRFSQQNAGQAVISVVVPWCCL